MAFIGGAFLRIFQIILRVIQLLASIVALGVFSYFLAILADHHLPIASWIKAVEGMSGAAVLYGIFCVLLTLCLGGIAFFAFLAVVLDICFIGAFAAIAYYNRHGTGSCSGTVNTPLGSGPASSSAAGYGANGFGFGSGENVTYAPNLHRACRLETAVFAVAIINIILFFLTAVFQVLLVRHHRKEKRYGPSPANNYTSGAGRRQFWKRGNKRNTRDAELATGGLATGGLATEKHNGIRPSHDTSYTGSTVNNTQGYPYAHNQSTVPATTATNY